MSPETETPEEKEIFITLEDEVVCEGCIKADVCEILKSVMRLGMAGQNLQQDFSVKLKLSASIYECQHKVGETIGINL